MFPPGQIEPVLIHEFLPFVQPLIPMRIRPIIAGILIVDGSPMGRLVNRTIQPGIPFIIDIDTWGAEPAPSVVGDVCPPVVNGNACLEALFPFVSFDEDYFSFSFYPRFSYLASKLYAQLRVTSLR